MSVYICAQIILDVENFLQYNSLIPTSDQGHIHYTKWNKAYQ